MENDKFYDLIDLINQTKDILKDIVVDDNLKLKKKYKKAFLNLDMELFKFKVLIFDILEENGVE